MRGRRRHILVLGILAGALVGALLLASAIGRLSIPPLEIARMVLDKVPFLDLSPTWRPAEEAVLFQLRLPRVLGGALVGAALATAGVLFQGLLRNPLADPYIIGTSAGAALGATLAMMLPLGAAFFGFGLVPVAAFLGALGAVLVVYNLARVGGRTPVISMLLAGFVVSSLLAAAMSFLMILSDPQQVNLGRVFTFLMGSISAYDGRQLLVIGILIGAGVVVARLLAHHLNAFALGEEGAAYVGINVEREKILVLALGSLLTASAVSLSGLVGFVGLVTPHAVRLALGPDHRLLVPAAALAGATFLVVADLAAQTVLPSGKLPVGILTALIGAPFFLYLLRRTRKEYAF